MTVKDMGRAAKLASRKLAVMGSIEKNKILEAMAEALVKYQEDIIKANAIDVEKGIKNGLSSALVDRLKLTPERIEGIAGGIKEVMALLDPVGEGMRHWKQPNGIEISQVRVPLGVIGMIYESRPNVTVDAAVLCLKSGNAIILRGGSEAIQTNKALAKVIMDAGVAAGMPVGAVQLIEDTDRQRVTELIQMNDCVDVIIPRGGKGLKKAIIANATVPVIETGAGVCHGYIDASADLEMAQKIVINAKVQRPGVCNSIEALLVHQSVAEKFLPQVAKALKENGVEVRACSKALPLMENAIAATEEDWGQEYLALILGVKVVADIEEAMEYIHQYSSGHSEVIVTKDYTQARRFQQGVDASSVYVNASTRFTDGGEFGFGAEIGISTQKLHARGPMGLRELTTYKYLIMGEGQIR